MRSSTGRLALMGLLVLLVADAALVALAFRPDAVGAEPAAPAPRSTPVTSTPTPSRSPQTRPVPLRQVVVALDDRRAWRAVLGTCDKGGAALEVTADGGRTWGSRVVPARALGRVQPVSADNAFVIGADASCRAEEYVTEDGARSWKAPRALDGTWSRTPGGATSTAVTPERPSARPCGAGALVDLARVSARSARALCADGTVMTSSDGGAAWSRLTRVGGALALSVRQEQGSARAYVARVADGCDGIEVARLTGASTGTSAGSTGSASGSTTSIACVAAPDGVPQGRVSISVVEEAGWLAVGDTTWRAGSDLRAWTRTA
jgi:hypothetical protein